MRSCWCCSPHFIPLKHIHTKLIQSCTSWNNTLLCGYYIYLTTACKPTKLSRHSCRGTRPTCMPLLSFTTNASGVGEIIYSIGTFPYTKANLVLVLEYVIVSFHSRILTFCKFQEKKFSYPYHYKIFIYFLTLPLPLQDIYLFSNITLPQNLNSVHTLNTSCHTKKITEGIEFHTKIAPLAGSG